MTHFRLVWHQSHFKNRFGPMNTPGEALAWRGHLASTTMSSCMRHLWTICICDFSRWAKPADLVVENQVWCLGEQNQLAWLYAYTIIPIQIYLVLVPNMCVSFPNRHHLLLLGSVSPQACFLFNGWLLPLIYKISEESGQNCIWYIFLPW